MAAESLPSPPKKKKKMAGTRSGWSIVNGCRQRDKNWLMLEVVHSRWLQAEIKKKLAKAGGGPQSVAAGRDFLKKTG